MNMLAHSRSFRHRCDDTIAEVVRMSTWEPHPSHSVNRADCSQQIGEIVQSIEVRVDRLPEKDNFRETLINGGIRLADNVGELAAALRSARGRDDAVRAAVVAAALNRDPRLDAV